MTDSTFPSEEENEEQQQQNADVSIPLGGPIYVSNLVGPFTSVPEFQSSALQHLLELGAELCQDSCEEDISVDELKILSEEELVNKALEEAFKDDNKDDQTVEANGEEGRMITRSVSACEDAGATNEERENGTSEALDLSEYSVPASDHKRRLKKNNVKKRKRGGALNHDHTQVDNRDDQIVEANCDEGRLNAESISAGKNAGVTNTENENGTSRALELSEGSVLVSGSKRRSKKNNVKKRKRRGAPNQDDNQFITKVEQVAKIKQKQEEDKVAARLHSFNGSNHKIDECVAPSTHRFERMTTLRSMSTSMKQVKSSNVYEHVPVLYPEVVLCVEVYHNIRTLSKTQEFLVLGQQTLTELRDHIYCLTDEVMHKAGQHDPSGYFLIEDVFCNDLRDPSAINYSEPIFRWLWNSKDEALKKWEFLTSGQLLPKQKAVLGNLTTSQLPRFRAVDMQTTRFCDLSFRLGASYLYCHQGDCKHTIVIRDMRLIHSDDVQNRLAYPILVFQLKLRFRKCYVCKINRATKVTVDDKWAQDNPCYFCHECFMLLHCSADGMSLYSGFQTYDYEHD